MFMMLSMYSGISVGTISEEVGRIEGMLTLVSFDLHHRKQAFAANIIR
jgi:hypothetical protein